MEIYPSHVVVSWIGHSEKVARKHYLQTTDAHFEKAVAHQVAHNQPEVTKTNKPTKAKNPENTNVFRGSSETLPLVRRVELPRRDSNPN